MSAIVIGIRGPEAAGRERRDIRPAQPYAGGTAQINPTRVTGKSHPHGLAGVRELATVRMSALVARERIVATIRCSKHLNSPAFNSQSASSQADTGAWSSVTTTLARLRLQFSKGFYR